MSAVSGTAAKPRPGDAAGPQGAVAHLIRSGLAGLATLGPDGTVRSRDGDLSRWLPEIGRSCLDSPILSGLDQDLDDLRGDDGAGEPLVLPGVRLAGPHASPRCHVLITWNGGAGEYAVLTTIDGGDRPIDHWVLQQKREQRLLEERLVAASREIDRMNADLRRFTSMAAHDLQAPLRQITVFAGLLRSELPGGSDALDHLDTIDRCAGRLTGMITGLLDHARLSAEAVVLEPLRMNDPVEDALANLRVEIMASGAEVSLGELPVVVGSRSLLTNMFQNMLANSLRYRSAERPLRIEVRVDSDDGGAGVSRVLVSDNGIGVPPQYAEAIFGSFVRIPARGPESAARSAGAGLGLGLCRKIAELHGWNLRLDLRHRPGARFCLAGLTPPRDRNGGADRP